MDYITCQSRLTYNIIKYTFKKNFRKDSIFLYLKASGKCLSFLYNFILLKKLSSIPSFDYSVYFDVNLIENGPIVTPQLDAPFWSFWRLFWGIILIIIAQS